MKSMLVIGLGKFGQHLANKLQQLGNDVMIIDNDDAIINEMSATFREAYAGDCTKYNVIKNLGVNNFDVCFVTTCDDFQASLEITSLLKEFGAKYIVSKAKSDLQAKFLKEIGANEIVYLEKDMAERLAIKFNANNVFDYIELGSDYAIYEIPVVPSWVGKTILEIDVRKNYHVNVIAIKKANKVSPQIAPDYIFEVEDHLMVVAGKKEIEKLTNLIK